MEILLALLVGGLIVYGYGLHRRVTALEDSIDTMFSGGRLIRIDGNNNSEDGSGRCAECGGEDDGI